MLEKCYKLQKYFNRSAFLVVRHAETMLIRLWDWFPQNLMVYFSSASLNVFPHKSWGFSHKTTTKKKKKYVSLYLEISNSFPNVTKSKSVPRWGVAGGRTNLPLCPTLLTFMLVSWIWTHSNSWEREHQNGPYLAINSEFTGCQVWT